MNEFDLEIMKVDNVICDNISKKDALGEQLLSQNIIAQLRNFVEAVALKIYSLTCETEVTYDEKQKALNYIKSWFLKKMRLGGENPIGRRSFSRWGSSTRAGF